ncbi:MAG: 2-hydroxyacid dehydrogenase [Geminicoccaceae bacterium]|nr:2-hydroxyacid dehydrogenase [Geminicoccaceae bacterium]MCB9944314.1 2-hydroxyacid dehydrogenase [Geminicoccaceae bacterium]
MTTRTVIIGDHFMRPDYFEAELRKIDGLEFRSFTLDWPDKPFIFSRDHGELAGLREFLGEPDGIVEMIGNAEVLVTHLAPISDSILKRCPDLKLIAVSRGGPVNIDMDACRVHGVKVANAPGRNATAVAEFTIGAILMETRLMRLGHETLRAGVWRGDLYRADITGPELSELTVGLIGYGHIGSKVTRLLRPFGCRILVNDPYVGIDDEDRTNGVEQVDLDTLLEQSHVVSLHARVTDETRGFLAREQFAKMRKGAWFINTARGPMVNYEDLRDALKSGHLRGAMLETFWQEPPPADAEILRLPNVTLTPHIAGASTTTIRTAAVMVADEIRRWRAGEPLKNPC